MTTDDRIVVYRERGRFMRDWRGDRTRYRQDLARAAEIGDRWVEKLGGTAGLDEPSPRGFGLNLPTDEHTLDRMHVLSELYFEAGRLASAISLGEECVKAYKATFGVERDQTRHVMRELAVAYRGADRVPDAIRILTEILVASRNDKEPDNETLLSMRDLARIHQDAGRTEESIGLCRKVVEIRKRRDVTDLELLIDMNNLAVSYNFAGRFDECIELFKDCIERGKTVLGPDHLNQLFRMNNLASTLFAAEMFTEAERLFRDVKGRLETKSPPFADPELVASVACGLGLTLIRLDRHTEAEQILRESLAFQDKVRPNPGGVPRPSAC